MSFVEEIATQGRWLVRRRHWLPLFLLPLFALAQLESTRHEAALSDGFEDAWKLACLALALTGAAIRITAAAQGSLRQGDPTARAHGPVRLIDIFFMVRRPRTAGTIVIVLAIALEMKLWWLVVLAWALAALTLERVLAVEERASRSLLDDEMTADSGTTATKLAERAAVWKSPIPFRRALVQEHATLLWITTAFFAHEFLDAMTLPSSDGVDRVWLVLVSSSALFSTAVMLGTRILAFPQLHWDLEPLSRRELRADAFGVSKKVTRVRYPIRLFRYWFVCHLLQREHRRLRRPYSVCEVGIDRGQMRAFMLASGPAASSLFARWDGVDCAIQHHNLQPLNYSALVEADVEKSGLPPGPPYDVLILLHVLEHLAEPERVLRALASHLRDGGSVVGGFPVHPDWAAPWRERILRRTAAPRGHVSAFSVSRLKAMAQGCGMSVEFVSGAFLMRMSGSALENRAWWARLNLLLGALVPGWPGELYWVLRKRGQ